jgi:hypothetical protein
MFGQLYTPVHAPPAPALLAPPLEAPPPVVLLPALPPAAVTLPALPPADLPALLVLMPDAPPTVSPMGASEEPQATMYSAPTAKAGTKIFFKDILNLTQ